MASNFIFARQLAHPKKRFFLGGDTLASGLAARPRPPRGALSARIVSTAPAPDGNRRR